MWVNVYRVPHLAIVHVESVHRYHFALGDVRSLSVWWDVYRLGPEARTKTARQLLQVMRKKEFRAESRYFKLLAAELERLEMKDIVTAADIPDDLAARAEKRDDQRPKQ